MYQVVRYYQIHHHLVEKTPSFFFVGCYNTYSTLKCIGVLGGRTFTAKYKNDYKEWLKDPAEECVKSMTARSAHQLTVPEAAIYEHD